MTKSVSRPQHLKINSKLRQIKKTIESLPKERLLRNVLRKIIIKLQFNSKENSKRNSRMLWLMATPIQARPIPRFMVSLKMTLTLELKIISILTTHNTGSRKLMNRLLLWNNRCQRTTRNLLINPRSKPQISARSTTKWHFKQDMNTILNTGVHRQQLLNNDWTKK